MNAKKATHKIIADIALNATKLHVNTFCPFGVFRPKELPKGAEKLKKKW